jgi:hypothetical protein
MRVSSLSIKKKKLSGQHKNLDRKRKAVHKKTKG